MNWRLENDNTDAIITSEKLLLSEHGGAKNISNEKLPETCVLFEIGVGIRFIEENYETITIIEQLPCFLENPKCIMIKDNLNVCFVRGGYGAPAAVDTLETIRALGVKRIIVVGMFGGFGNDISVGDLVIPNKILSEEGTSHHYFENFEFAIPDKELFEKAQSFFKGKFSMGTDATVTTDAVYRQTFAKEALWREKGCVGVDMESSALLAISKYYSIPAVSLLLCSDKHPIDKNDIQWSWGDVDFREVRKNFIRQVVEFSLKLKT